MLNFLLKYTFVGEDQFFSGPHCYLGWETLVLSTDEMVIQLLPPPPRQLQMKIIVLTHNKWDTGAPPRSHRFSEIF
jgi:hypothetical protein